MLDLMEVPEALRQQAMERFRLLEPYLIHGHELQSVAAASGVPYRTLQRWWRGDFEPVLQT